MTAIAIRKSTPRSAAGSRDRNLDGTGPLVRLILRRERIRLPAWILGLSVLLTVFLRALANLTETQEQRRDLLRIMEGGIGAIFGPGYGRYDITAERYVVGVYGLFFFVLAALMTMLLVVRHTRAEEQNGLAELIRSNVAGRHAHLTAALIVAVGANAVLALALATTMVASGHDGADGMLFGASVGAVGLVFAGISALTVQLSGYSRTATGLAGAVLGVFWVVRAAGDMIRDYGSPLSWFSPLAWSNQTRPYVDGRWWPLLLSVGFAAVAAASAYVVSTRRDGGAGLIASRPGPPMAARWLRSPFAAAYRLQRGRLLWWTVSLATFGFIFGVLGDQVADPENMSEARIEMFGGSVDTLLDGYLGVMTQFMAGLTGVMVVLGVQAVRQEETSGRAEPVLATATSRWAWLGSYLAVMALGVIGVLAVTGFATGIGAAVSVGDSAYILDVPGAHLAHAPGVLSILGIAALLYGLIPRALGVTWGVVGYSLFVGMFGTTMDLPRRIQELSPMEHIGQPPLESVSWPAMSILILVAVGLMGAGLAGFRRRDLESK